MTQQEKIEQAAKIANEEFQRDASLLVPQKEHFKEGFLQGYEHALSHQWISVEEALPECDKCHLAMYEDGGIIVAKYENETWWWQDGFVVGRNTEGDLMYSSSCEVPSGLISHWAPIPSLEGGEE